MLSANEIFDAIKQAKHLETDGELGKLLGISVANLGMKRKRNSIPFKEIMEAFPGIDFNKLFFAKQFVESENHSSQYEKTFYPSQESIDLQLLQQDIHKSIETMDRFSRIMEQEQENRVKSQNTIDRLTRILEQATGHATGDQQQSKPHLRRKKIALHPRRD